MAGNEFSFAVRQFIEKAQGNVDGFMREFNQDLAEKVQENTPFLTGFLRSSWTASIGVPDTAFQGSGNPDTSRISLILQDVKATDTVYHTNNAKYGPFVEFGTSRMEPRAFVRKTIAQASQIAEDVVRRINK